MSLVRARGQNRPQAAPKRRSTLPDARSTHWLREVTLLTTWFPLRAFIIQALG